MSKETLKKRGRVKWFSQRKKYGFVVDEKDKEYFFHQDRLPKGTPLPQVKDIVEFEPLTGKRGEKAANLKILIPGESDKFKCPNCREEIIPKIIEKERRRGSFVTEIINASVCPKCDHEFKEFVENEEEKIKLLFKVLFLTALVLTITFFIF